MNSVPEIPWSTTGGFMLGLIGVLGVAWLVLQVIIGGRKLFGHKPPIDDQLAILEKRLQIEFRSGDESLSRTIKLIAEELAELQAERLRTWKELKEDFRTLSTDVAFIRGRCEFFRQSEDRHKL